MSQLNARDIARRLAGNPESVARYLLGSEGKKSGAELRYGSLSGEAGQSLGIHLTGDKAGVWSDFAGGDGGDLLDLWRLVRSLSVSEAMAEAKKYLGLEDIVMHGAGARSTPRTPPIQRPDTVKSLRDDARAFLGLDRNISAHAAEVYLLGQRGDEIAFPFKSPAGELLNIKYRRFPNDAVRTEAGGAKVLFGWQAIPCGARSVVICEGEYKALIWYDYGFPALSVPYGAGKGKQEWIEAEYDRLAQFDTIYVAMDEDEHGRVSTEEIVQRLGADRCAVVALPLPEGGKDIQSCKRADVPAERIQAAIKAAAPRGPAELKSAGEYRDEVVALFTDTGPEPGLRTPWKKIGDDLVFRPGELTILAGRTGNGKSQLVGFLLCFAIQIGFRICVASFEFKVRMWLFRLMRQLTALGRPAGGYVGRVMDWLNDDRLWAFDAQGTAEWKRMIEVFRYCRRRHDVLIFVVDNLTGLGIHEEDYQGQKEVIQALANFARDEDCHVFLVHHVRKGGSSQDQPDQADIKGSGAITDLASTVLTVWRNRSKEDKIKALAMIGGQPDDELASEPDVRVKCSKQRNYYGLGDGEPTIALWWNGETFHYLGSPRHVPRAFVRLDAPPLNLRDGRGDGQ